MSEYGLTRSRRAGAGGRPDPTGSRGDSDPVLRDRTHRLRVGLERLAGQAQSDHSSDTDLATRPRVMV
eukprot:755748-Hanusia_phi.AAC.10